MTFTQAGGFIISAKYTRVRRAAALRSFYADGTNTKSPHNAISISLAPIMNLAIWRRFPYAQSRDVIDIALATTYITRILPIFRLIWLHQHSSPLASHANFSYFFGDISPMG